MNPTLSLAASIVASIFGRGANAWSMHYIYWIGPLIGAAVAAWRPENRNLRVRRSTPEETLRVSHQALLFLDGEVATSLLATCGRPDDGDRPAEFAAWFSAVPVQQSGPLLWGHCNTHHYYSSQTFH